jgi:hypothetical protein
MTGISSREVFCMNFYERFIDEPIKGFVNKILEFLPNVLSALLIFFFGLLAGWLTKLVLRKVFDLIRLDGFAERTGIRKILDRGGLQEPLSLLLARIAGGFIVLAFFVVSLGTLNIEVIQRLTERFFYFLPSAFVALVIIIVGYILGNFFGRAALIACVNAGVKMSRLVGRAVKYLIIIVSASMALEHLGIGRDTVLISYAIILSGFALAFALAFGLGGRDAAKDLIEKKLKGEDKENDFRHL